MIFLGLSAHSSHASNSPDSFRSSGTYVFLIQVRSRPIDSARSKRAKCYLIFSSCEQEKTNFGQRFKTNFATHFHSLPGLPPPEQSDDLPIFVLLSNPSKKSHHKKGMDDKMKLGYLFSTFLSRLAAARIIRSPMSSRRDCHCAQASFNCFKNVFGICEALRGAWSGR